MNTPKKVGHTPGLIYNANSRMLENVSYEQFKLFSNAPELLEACECVLEKLANRKEKPITWGMATRMEAVLQQAIANARGEA